MLSGAKVQGIGDAGYGIGVDRPGDDRNVVAGPGAGLGDAGVKVAFGSNDDNDPVAEDDAYDASASFVSDSATFSAFVSNNDEQDHRDIVATLGPGAMTPRRLTFRKRNPFGQSAIRRQETCAHSM